MTRPATAVEHRPTVKIKRATSVPVPAPPADERRESLQIQPASTVPDVPDTYEEHLPTEGRFAKLVDQLASKVAPMRTHERVMTEASGSFFGVDVGFTISQLDLVKKHTHGREIVQVVNADGSSNVELILGRTQLGLGQRLELQGPALNTSLTPGQLPLGARFIGVGLTSDVTSAMDHDALSYTVEVKLTERFIAEMATLGGAGAAKIAAEALTSVGAGAAAQVISEVIRTAVPVLSVALAVSSARRALHVCRDPKAGPEMKAFAVLHALADAVRVVNPLAGVIGNATLVGVAALVGWLHVRHAKHAPPTGPPTTTNGAGAKAMA